MLTWLFCITLVQLKGHGAFVVDSPSGLLSGWMGTSRDGRAYRAFTKIPYALPPVGTLRLKNPVPHGRWEGLYEATQDLPECIQDNTGTVIGSSDVSGTEDCLYLSVYVPEGDQTDFPVVFSVFGGAFVSGSVGPRYLADFFMDENVVLVVMNYRFGPLGFMSLEEPLFPGNFGLKDQALALKWTKNNIASFGGNPDLITVLGVSAGAASVHHLMLSPVTRDLIKGAVTISGTVNKVWSLKPPGLMRARTRAAAKILGCDVEDNQKLLICLQALDAWKIHASRHIFPHDIAFAPTIEQGGDDSFIPVDPLTYRSTTPWLNSITNGERLLKYKALKKLGGNYVEEIMKDKLNEFIGVTVEVKLNESKPNEHRILNKLKAKYIHLNSTDNAYDLGILFEDVTFLYPAFDALERHYGPVYLARFECDFQQDGYRLAAHGSETKLMFRTSLTSSPLLTLMSRRYLRLITDFVKNQNPTPDMSWIPWTSNQLLRITCDGSFMDRNHHVYSEKEYNQGYWKGLFCDPTLIID